MWEIKSFPTYLKFRFRLTLCMVYLWVSIWWRTCTSTSSRVLGRALIICCWVSLGTTSDMGLCFNLLDYGLVLYRVYLFDPATTRLKFEVVIILMRLFVLIATQREPGTIIWMVQHKSHDSSNACFSELDCWFSNCGEHRAQKNEKES